MPVCPDCLQCCAQYLDVSKVIPGHGLYVIMILSFTSIIIIEVTPGHHSPHVFAACCFWRPPWLGGEHTLSGGKLVLPRTSTGKADICNVEKNHTLISRSEWTIEGDNNVCEETMGELVIEGDPTAQQVVGIHVGSLANDWPSKPM